VLYIHFHEIGVKVPLFSTLFLDTAINNVIVW